MDAVTSNQPVNSATAAANAAVAAAQAADTAAADGNEASNALTADFETFLKLLTTQMENQDPQEPIDSTQFVSQLASFSAVEQQIATNTKLDDLIGTMTANAAGEMASWVGSEVKSKAATEFSGAPIDIFYELPADSAQGQISIKSEDGATVAQLTVEPGSVKTTWDGKGSDGLTAANGTYSFEATGFDRTAKSLGSGPAETFSRVSEVRLDEGDLTLVFADGTTLPSKDVVAVR